MTKILKLLFLIPPFLFSTAFGFRIWTQSMTYAVPTGDDPAFHALTIVEISQNPSCIFAHLFGHCRNPLIESTWQYPNIIHVLFTPVYLYTQDPIFTIKLLYTLIGLFISYMPVLIYILTTINRRDPGDLALISTWYTASSFLLYNNLIYTYAEGSIFELLGISLLPLIYYVKKPVPAGMLAGLTVVSYTATLFVFIATAPYVVAQGLRYLAKFVLSYLVVANIFFIKFIIFIPTAREVISAVIHAKTTLIDAIQLHYPQKTIVLLATLPAFLLTIVSTTKNRQAVYVYAGYFLFLLGASTLWDRALRYVLIILYIIPLLYPLDDEKAKKIFAVATAGLAAFVLFNAHFYTTLFQPTQDLIRADPDTLKLYERVAKELSVRNVTKVATICQLSSYLLPILQAHGIVAYCLLDPSVKIPSTDPLYDVTQALKKALEDRDLTPLRAHIDVLIIEPPRRGSLYAPSQVALYNDLVDMLEIKPRDGIYIIWIST